MGIENQNIGLIEALNPNQTVQEAGTVDSNE